MIHSNTPRLATWTLALMGLLTGVVRDAFAATFTYDTSVNSRAWLNSNNWTGGPANKAPGVDNNASSTIDNTPTDIAVIGNVSFSASSGLAINMDSSANTGVNNNTGANGRLVLGAINLTATAFSDATTTLQVGNSSTTHNGVLQLNGATISLGGYTVSNTILAATGSKNLTIANVSSGSAPVTMNLHLNNVTNVIQAASVNAGDTPVTVSVSSNITEQDPGSFLFLYSPYVAGREPGQLVLSGSNSFTGALVVGGYDSFADPTAVTHFGVAYIDSTAALPAAAQVETLSRLVLRAAGSSVSYGSAGTPLELVNGGLEFANPTLGSTTSWNGDLGLFDDGLGLQNCKLTVFGNALTVGQINGAVYGPGNLDIHGPGVLRLANANTHTGITRIRSGALILGHSAALQSSTLDMDGADNGALSFGNLTSATFGGLSGGRNISLQNDVAAGVALSVGANSTASPTYAGELSGAGSLTKVGTSTQTLTGNNGYQGGTTINGGTLRGATIADFGVPSNFGAGHLAINNGSTLRYTGATASTNRNVSLGGVGGVIDVENAASLLTVTGQVSGSALTKVGPGSFILSAANTCSGGTTIDNGVLVATNATGSATGSGSITVAAGAILQIGYGPSGDADKGNVSGDIINNGVLSFDRSNDLEFGNQIDGSAGQLYKYSGGVLTLTGNNGYQGGTTINGGTLRGTTIANFGVPSNFGAGNFTINNGATLRYAGASASTNRTISLGGVGGVLDVENGAALLTVSGQINGSALTKVGAGTLILSGANTYSGGTIISNGVVVATNATGSATGSGLITIGAGALLQIGYGPTGDADKGSVSGDIANNGVLSFDRSTDIVHGGQIDGSTGQLYKYSGGVLTLTGTNGYLGGTTINGGTLRGATIADFGVPSNFGAGHIAINHGATLRYAGATASTNRNISLGGVGGVAEVENVNGTLTIAGEVSGGALTKTGPGVLTLNGNNTFSGGTTVNGGTLAGATITNFGVPSSLGAGHIAINHGATLRYVGASASTNRNISLGGVGGGVDVENVNSTLTVAGDISGSGLTKTGAGTLILSNANTYSGGTKLVAGALAISSDSVLGDPLSHLFLQGGTLRITDTITSSRSFEISSGSIDTNGQNLTLTGTVSGSSPSNSLMKIGNGALTFSGSADVGNLRIGGGTIVAGTSTALQKSVVDLNATDSGTLSFGGLTAVSIGSITGSRNQLLQNDSSAPVVLTVRNLRPFVVGYSSTYSGQFTGSGSLVVSGLGTLTLTGANLHTGGTAITNDGVVSVSADANLGAPAGNLRLGSDGRLLITAAMDTARSVTLDGGVGIIDTNGFDSTFSGVITGIGTLAKAGTGTLTLSNVNNFSGQTRFSGGTVLLTNPLALQNSTVFYNGAGVLSFGSLTSATIGGLEGNKDFTLTNASMGNVDLTVGTNNTNVSFNAVLSGGGSLTKVGAGTQFLSRNNTYSGGTFLNGGTLRIISNESLGNSLTALTFNGGRLWTTASVNSGRAMVVNAGGGTIDVFADAFSSFHSNFSGIISGVGPLTKAGNGMLTLGGTNTFSGDTKISGGTLILGNVAALQNCTLDYDNYGGTLSFGALITATLGGLKGNQGLALTNASPASVDLTVGGNNQSTTYGGALSGSGSLLKIGAGELTLTGANVFSGGTTINNGALVAVNSAGSATGSGPISIGPSGVLRIGDGASGGLVGSVSGDITNDGYLSFDRSNDIVFGNQVDGSAGQLYKYNSGVLTLTGNNGYLGGTTINGGTLRGATIANFGAPSNFGGGHLAINHGATLRYTGVTASTNRTISLGGVGGVIDVENINSSLTVTGEVGGSALTKIGTGTLILAGANSYTSGTAISAGKLAVNGSILGPVAIHVGGALGGEGTVNGNVGGDGRVAPGNSPGLLTIIGNYTQGAGALDIELAAPGNFDTLYVNGNVTLGGVLDVSLLGGYVPTAGTAFDFLNWTGTLNGTFTTLNLPPLPGGMVWSDAELYTTGVLRAVAAADFEEDGDVDGGDLAKWRTDFGLATGGTHRRGDADGDQDVDGRDFLAWQRQFGTPLLAVSVNDPVPEPATSLLGIVAVAGIRRMGGQARQKLVSK